MPKKGKSFNAMVFLLTGFQSKSDTERGNEDRMYM